MGVFVLRTGRVKNGSGHVSVGCQEWKGRRNIKVGGESDGKNLVSTEGLACTKSVISCLLHGLLSAQSIFHKDS